MLRTLPFDPKTGFYEKRYFLYRLKEERRRSERTGLPFSIATLDISDLAKFNNTLKNHQLKKIVTSVVSSNTREIDIKAWIGNHKLTILMPDTSIDHAKPLIKKIRREIIRATEGLSKERHPPNIDTKFHLSSFPESDLQNRGSFLEKDGTNPNMAYADLFDLPLLRECNATMKRIVDIVGALLGIVFLSPLFGVIAVLIKITSPGPVFFQQRRVGLLGREFNFLKFRSMYSDSDEAVHRRHVSDLMNHRVSFTKKTNAVRAGYKIADDERVTKIGRFLRKTSLDEIPQLLNVLRGDMSLVGPRPHPTYEVQQYSNWELARLEIMPGITGLGQLSKATFKNYENVYRQDLKYCRQFSTLADFRLMLRTISLLIFGKLNH